jgi:ADP-heptose:LPS heptosyltransferase
VETQLPSGTQFFIDETSRKKIENLLKEKQLSRFIALCPSAAHEIKRWPLDHWKKLITLLPKEIFVVLGGPQDHFLSELTLVNPTRVWNLSGQLSLLESCALIEKATWVVSNDTGLMHISEQLLKPTIALLGPTPFGYPSRVGTSTYILEKNIPCRPCSRYGKGQCTNPHYKECLSRIQPEDIVEILNHATSI